MTCETAAQSPDQHTLLALTRRRSGFETLSAHREHACHLALYEVPSFVSRPTAALSSSLSFQRNIRGPEQPGVLSGNPAVDEGGAAARVMMRRARPQ